MLNELYTIPYKSKTALDKYIKFIEDRRDSKYDGYTERHHILPKSLFPHYKSDPDNIIVLSGADHLRAHMLLAEAYKGKMLYALKLLVEFKNGDFEYELEPEDYEVLRESLRDEYSVMMKAYYKTPAGKKHKAKMSKVMKKEWADERKRAKRIKNMRKTASTEEFRKKSSINSKAAWEDPEIRAERLKKMRATMQTEEYREKHRQNQLKRMQDPELRKKCRSNLGNVRPSKVCPHCGREDNLLIFFNRHFYNCRKIKDIRASFIRLYLLSLEVEKDSSLNERVLHKQHLHKFIYGFKHYYNNE